MDTGISSETLTLMALPPLSTGSHTTPADGMCLMEACAYVAGEEHSDMPACVSPILSAFGRGLNDRMPDHARQLLKRFIPSLLGTAGDAASDVTRAFLAVDRVMRFFVPRHLESLGASYVHAAGVLRNSPSVTTVRGARDMGRRAQRLVNDLMDTTADVAFIDVADAIDDAAQACYSLSTQAYTYAAINAAYTAVFGAYQSMEGADFAPGGMAEALGELVVGASCAQEVGLLALHAHGFTHLTPEMFHPGTDSRATTAWAPALQLFHDLINVRA